MKIDALSIYMTFTTFIVELWKLHKLTFRQIATETDPSMIQGQISLNQAYEEEFSQVILPYNTKEYTIGQAREILMKYASIYPKVVKHMKEYKKMVDNAVADMTKIAGQKPAVTRTRKAIANFKIRENMPIGCMVTLRGERRRVCYDVSAQDPDRACAFLYAKGSGADSGRFVRVCFLPYPDFVGAIRALCPGKVMMTDGEI